MVVGRRRVGSRASKWSQIDQHGPTWSQKDTKREAKVAKTDWKAPTFVFKVKKCDKKAINKNRRNDVQKRSLLGHTKALEPFGPDHLVSRFMLKMIEFAIFLRAKHGLK